MSSSVTDPTSGTWQPTTICRLLTAERMISYMRACNNDADAALDLYDWNLRASAAVLQTVAMVEVVVRNALDGQLVTWAARHQQPWFSSAPLDSQGKSDVATAMRRATRNGRHPLVHGKMVAELNLGFWRYLTASRYLTSLWVPALYGAFPFGHTDLRQRRADVEQHLAQLTFVRNRAVHHEPIHRRDLQRDCAAATDLAGRVDPQAAWWLRQRTELPAVLAARPVPPGTELQP